MINRMKGFIINITKAMFIRNTVLLLLIFVLPVTAQTTKTLPINTDSKPSDKDITAEFNLFTEAGIEYLDNVYGLSESQESLYNADDVRDINSGRYNDMESFSDYILKPRIGIRFQSWSPMGGKFRAALWLRYNYYIKNEKCRYPEGRIKLEQTVYKKGDLILEGNFIYGFFKKNYLSGAVDINSNGNIPRSERIYSPAVYDEYEGILGYEYKFIKGKEDKKLSGFSILPFIGCRYRIYNSTFDNRNQDVVLGGLALNLELVSRIKIKTTYRFEGIFCPNKEELILFNESSTGSDINNDNDINNNAPVITKIDRSCSRHIIEIEPSFKLTGDWLFLLGYKQRKTIYKTENQLDIERYNQKKDYWRIKAGMEYEFSNDWSAKIEWSKTEQNDIDDGKYSQNSYIAEIKYKFN
jgi:hypothetical protein